MRSLVQSFAKAGPIPTTAGLCVLFLLIAVVSSGLVNRCIDLVIQVLLEHAMLYNGAVHRAGVEEEIGMRPRPRFPIVRDAEEARCRLARVVFKVREPISTGFSWTLHWTAGLGLSSGQAVRPRD